MKIETVYKIAQEIAKQLDEQFKDSIYVAAFLNDGKVSIRLMPVINKDIIK